MNMANPVAPGKRSAARDASRRMVRFVTWFDRHVCGRSNHGKYPPLARRGKGEVPPHPEQIFRPVERIGA